MYDVIITQKDNNLYSLYYTIMSRLDSRWLLFDKRFIKLIIFMKDK